MLFLVHCHGDQEAKLNMETDSSSAETKIDHRSYNLGVIGAFAEVVDIGIKDLALSSPLHPQEMDALIEEARKIAERNNVTIYREDNFLTTDLFPAELTDGKHVLLIYKGNTNQRYLDLKSQKEQLLKSGKYKSAARQDIARKFGKLLSYPEARTEKLLNKRL